MVQYTGGYASPRLDLGEAFKEYMASAEDFIGMQALGRFMTPRKSATFTKLTRESLLQPADTKRAPRSKYNRSNIQGEDQSYSCQERGQESLLDDSERSFYASDFDAEVASSQQAWWRVMNDIERACAAVLFNETTFTTGNGLRTDVSAAWATASTDINADVQTAKEVVRQRTGMMPNAMIVGAGVIPFFLKNDDLIQAIQYTKLPSVNEKLASLAAYFGLEKLLIGKAVYNSADEGQTYSGTDVWSSSFVSIARIAAEQAPLATPCVGRVMVWEQDTPEAVMMEEYRDESVRSAVYRARAHTDELLIDASFAQLLDIAA